MPQKLLKGTPLRIALIVLGLAAAVAAFYLPAAPPAVQHGYGEAGIGGTFVLTGTRGQTVKESDFRGKLMLVYMGYSHCPDICPMTLATMSEALKALGPDADKIAVLFISLDPERDAPQALAAYLASFDPRITGLTGSRQAIDEAAKAYKAYYKKVVTPNTGSYLIDHSGFLYLMDTRGKYLTHFEAGVKSGELAKAIRSYF
jgi:protein SCO1/2